MTVGVPFALGFGVMTNKFIFAVLTSSLLCAGVGAQTKNVAKPVLLTGLVAGTPTGKQFIMRANGQTYRVMVLPKVSLRNVRGGDRVRVWGIPTRLTLQRANVRVVESSASDNPDDYAPAGTTGAATPGAGVRPGTSNTTTGNGTTGTMSNGTMGNGTTGNGTMGNGTMSNGTMSNGTMSNGTVGNGTVGNGTTGKIVTPDKGRMSNGTTGTTTH